MADSSTSARDALRRLPSIDALLRDDRLAALPRPAVIREARLMLDELRRGLADGSESPAVVDEVATRLAERVRAEAAQHHRRVINGTGVVLHTGIGRAPMARAAREAVAEAAGYSLVEVDGITGQRNQRETRVGAMIAELSGTEAGLVVNNNAAAVNLILTALAAPGEVIVSRGELVEIGGGFRMPDVMAQAGCTMVEVGATNRTRLADFERAIGPDTRMLLSVHPSNFRIVGFTAMPTTAELAGLAREHGLLLMDDIGSGLLLDELPPALADEPKVRDRVRDGASIVCFSGDKLVGGPQCGLIVGSHELVRKVRAHPLYRAFRCDKLSLAALEATLRIHRDGDAVSEIPTLRAIARTAPELESLAQQLAQRLAQLLAGIEPKIIATESFVGSGANPARPMPSFAVGLPGGAKAADRLRTAGEVPIFARVEDGQALLDLRTLADENLEEVAVIAAACLR